MYKDSCQSTNSEYSHSLSLLTLSFCMCSTQPLFCFGVIFLVEAELHRMEQKSSCPCNGSFTASSVDTDNVTPEKFIRYRIPRNQRQAKHKALHDKCPGQD